MINLILVVLEKWASFSQKNTQIDLVYFYNHENHGKKALNP